MPDEPTFITGMRRSSSSRLPMAPHTPPLDSTNTHAGAQACTHTGLHTPTQPTQPTQSACRNFTHRSQRPHHHHATHNLQRVYNRCQAGKRAGPNTPTARRPAPNNTQSNQQPMTTGAAVCTRGLPAAARHGPKERFSTQDTVVQVCVHGASQHPFSSCCFAARRTPLQQVQTRQQ